MTIYTAISFDKRIEGTIPWRPWVNVDQKDIDNESIHQLVLNAAMRDSGGMSHKEDPKTVFYYWYNPETTPLDEKGNPTTCKLIEYKVDRL